MTGFEIALFVLGVAFIIISFFIVGGNERSAKDATLSAMDSSEFEELHEAFVDKTNRKADLILHDTEDKLESLSNDKIIAVGEYSDQILEKLEGNDKKVTFLYQMLNEKEEELKATVQGMENTRIDCEKLLREVASAKEAVDKAAAAAENRLSAAEALANSLSEMSLAQTQAASMAARNTDNGKTLKETDQERSAKEAAAGSKSEAVGDASLTDSIPDAPQTAQNSTKALNGAAKPAAATNSVKGSAPGKVPAGTGRSAAAAGGAVRRTASSQAGAGQNAPQRRRPASSQVSVSEMRSSEALENLDTGEINRNDEIIALHKSGKSIMEISKLLGMGQGEVKLIIDLYC